MIIYKCEICKGTFEDPRSFSELPPKQDGEIVACDFCYLKRNKIHTPKGIFRKSSKKHFIMVLFIILFILLMICYTIWVSSVMGSYRN
jgi:hypothetical protein